MMPLIINATPCLFSPDGTALRGEVGISIFAGETGREGSLLGLKC